MTTLERALLKEQMQLPARFRLYSQINHCWRNAAKWIAIDVVAVGLCLMALRVITA